MSFDYEKPSALKTLIRILFSLDSDEYLRGRDWFYFKYLIK